jgi:flavin reductase (DIM6/NTAB) family NADH-FMN oxidoreductase RutF
MNAAWGTQSDYNEIYISMGTHKTTDNLAKNPCFTVAFATKDTVVESDYFGIETGRKVNKIEKAGFHAVRSEKINAPIFEEYPVTLECKVAAFDDHGLWGEVVGMVVDDRVLNENGKIDWDKVQLISFDSSLNKYRLVSEIVGEAFKSGFEIKNK